TRRQASCYRAQRPSPAPRPATARRLRQPSSENRPGPGAAATRETQLFMKWRYSPLISAFEGPEGVEKDGRREREDNKIERRHPCLEAGDNAERTGEACRRDDCERYRHRETLHGKRLRAAAEAARLAKRALDVARSKPEPTEKE